MKIWDQRRKKRDYRANPDHYRAIARKYRGANKEEILKQAAARRKSSPEFFMLKSARRRARKGGYACTITAADIVIPEFCPLLGTRLERGAGKASPSSPSLDKVRPEFGYVPGNVWVISYRANELKRNASLLELQTLAANLAKTYVFFPWENL